MGSTGLGNAGIGALDLSPLGIPMQMQEGWRSGDDRAIAGAMMPGIKGKLDLSPAARRLRADQTMRPETVYHGTSAPENFRAFDLSKGGQSSGSRAAAEGVSVSPSPAVSDEFALGGHGTPSEHSRVLPLRYRSDKQAQLQLDGTERNNEVAATLAHAWDQGFDSVRLLNYTSPKGLKGQEVIVIQNPNQLRSVNAAFDPAKRESSDLSASLAPFLAAGGVAQNQQPTSP